MWFLWKQFQSEPVKEGVKTSARAEDVRELEQKILSFSMDGKGAKGAKQWHLEGDSAELVGDSIHLNNLRAIAYGDNVVVNLTSDSGIYDKENGEVELIGNVEVISDEGSRLTTEKARWSQETKEISTETLVKITRAEMTAIGTGGRANSDEKWAKLLKDVTVKMEPDTNVQCDGALEVSQTENKAVFYDKKTVYTVSHPLNGRFGIKDVSLSLPAVIGAKGLIREVDLNLSALEKKQLRQSANKLKVAEKSLKS